MYIVKQVAYIEDYYRVEDFCVVCSSYEDAQTFIFRAMLDEFNVCKTNYLNYERYSNLNDLMKEDDIAKALVKEMQSYQKPKFDQSRAGDKEYVRQHTELKHKNEETVRQFNESLDERREQLYNSLEEEFKNLSEELSLFDIAMDYQNSETIHQYKIEEVEIFHPEEV